MIARSAWLMGTLVVSIGLSGCVFGFDESYRIIVSIRFETFSRAEAIYEMEHGDPVVEWVNRETQLHTVTSDDGLFDSGDLKLRERFKFEFPGPGAYSYHCEKHAKLVDGEWTGMVAKVIVVPANETYP